MHLNCDGRAYYEYYLRHKYFVNLAWKEIKDIIINNELINSEEIEKINKLVLHHDESKLCQEEFLPYARKFYPIGEIDKDKVKADFKEAVKHHKSENLHHYESLKNYTGTDWKCYIIEMICDYIAMGWEFDNYIFEYYEANKEKIELPLEYREYLEEVLNVLKDPSMHYIEEPLTRKREVYLFLNK